MNKHWSTILGLVLVGSGCLCWALEDRMTWASFLFFFLFLVWDLWRAFKTGEIHSTLGLGRYSHTYHRDESPVLFTWAVIVQSLLTVGCFFGFLFSL
jgi:hypothetical protein